MGAMVLPIVMITIPVIFEKLEDEDLDFEALGMQSKSEDEIRDAQYQVDRISGFTSIRWKEKDYTLFWIDGYKFWAAIPYEEFNKKMQEKIQEFNARLVG